MAQVVYFLTVLDNFFLRYWAQHCLRVHRPNYDTKQNDAIKVYLTTKET